LHGSNRAFIDQVIPHIGSLLQDNLAETVAAAQTVVVTKRISIVEYDTLRSGLRPDHTLIDLVRLNGSQLDGFEGIYRGICW
jgi:hypothetical protein